VAAPRLVNVAVPVVVKLMPSGSLMLSPVPVSPTTGMVAPAHVACLNVIVVVVMHVATVVRLFLMAS